MKCSNCLQKGKITVCQQCLIDIENSKDYEEQENKKLRKKLQRKNNKIKDLKQRIKDVIDISNDTRILNILT